VLGFLQTYEYDLGAADLVHYGAYEYVGYRPFVCEVKLTPGSSLGRIAQVARRFTATADRLSVFRIYLLCVLRDHSG
jgi:hypothetical protein